MISISFPVHKSGIIPQCSLVTFSIPILLSHFYIGGAFNHWEGSYRKKASSHGGQYSLFPQNKLLHKKIDELEREGGLLDTQNDGNNKQNGYSHQEITA